MGRRTRVLLAALVVPLVPLAAPAPALAEPPHLHEHFRGTTPPGAEPLLCEVSPGVTVAYSEDARFHGQDLVKAVEDGTRQAFLGHTNFRFVAEHENLTTGEGFTVRVTGLFRELTAELVDAEAPFEPAQVRGEDGRLVPVVGPVYRFTAVENLHVQVRDDAGRLVSNERGRIRLTALFDTRGDSEPGGLLISEEFEVLSGTFAAPDFCDIALAVAP